MAKVRYLTTLYVTRRKEEADELNSFLRRAGHAGDRAITLGSSMTGNRFDTCIVTFQFDDTYYDNLDRDEARRLRDLEQRFVRERLPTLIRTHLNKKDEDQ